jgi:class 3 adenylate cyclase
MRCAACGHENRRGRRFCGQCGGRLSVACPSCGRPDADGARFCGHCGAELAAGNAVSEGDHVADASPGAPALVEREPRAYTPRHLADRILASRSALEGGRKQVTVLFVDVKGSTELAEQLDPEEWHRILDRFFHVLTQGVHRFEGTVNQYTGDGIMALFGAPIAHEDHAQRACYAALHLQEQLRSYTEELRLRGLSFTVRMGLNSGEVVVGKIGDDLRMDYTAQGHAVALAARVEELAEPGRVYLTDPTRRLVEGFMELRDLGAQHLRGIEKPVRVYELVGPGPLHTRLDAARTRGFSTLVGREPELAALHGALDRALEGQGQVVGIVGEAGVGKSRLALEFSERCRGAVATCEAHCPAHGATLPLQPIKELLRSFFALDGEEPEREVRGKIAERLGALRPSFEDELPLVWDLLDAPDPERPPPPASRAEARERLSLFLRRWVQAASAAEPLLLLLDDVHWIDPESDALLSQLVEAMGWTRTLLLVNYRPEYRAAWMEGSYCQSLALAPLERAAIQSLLQELLGDDPSLAPLVEQVSERTRGNPFFVEEVVQSLSASGHLAGEPGRYRLVRPGERSPRPFRR